MTDFNYLKANRAYNELYYQYPKVFIESETYRTLSEGAKIAYMLLKARSEIAIYKKQIDNEGNLYFEFTGKELSEMMNCSERRITAIKKELESFNLLKQVKMGFNKKTGKNEKNRLYLAELEVTNKDIYLMQSREINSESLDNGGLANFATRSENSQIAESIDNGGLANFATRSNIDKTVGNSGLANFAKELKNSNNLDTNRHLIDSDKDELQDKLLLENFVELNSNSQRVNATFVPDNVLKLIQTFSPSYSVAQTTVKTIHNAKNKAEQIAGIKMAYEEMDDYIANPNQGLYNTVLRAYQKQKNEEIKDMQNVIFTYVKNWFVEYPIQAKKAAQESDNLPNVSLHNWMD
jgi:hypothetical protein